MIETKDSNRIFYILLWVIACLFVTFLLMLSYNVRFCSDDFQILESYKTYGWFGSISHWSYNIRWSSYLLFSALIAINDDLQTIHFSIFIYYILIFTLLFSSLSLLLRSIFSRINLTISVSDSILFSVLSCIPLYFATTDAIEVWFWSIASMVYLLPAILFILGFALIISKKNTLLTYAGIGISFLFVGGGLESFALITLVILASIAGFSFLSKGHNLTILFPIKKLIFALFSTSVLFVFGLIGSGIQSRFSFEEQRSGFHGSYKFHLIMDALSEPKNCFYLFYSGLIFLLGFTFYQKKVNFPKINYKEGLFLNALFLIVILCISIVPLIISFHSISPKRAWFPFNFFFCSSGIFWLFYSGYVWAEKRAIPSFIKTGTAACGILIIAACILKQYPIVTNYSTQFDNRISYLQHLKKKGNKKEIGLRKLPDSGMVVSCEFRNQKGEENSILVEALDLPFNIYVVKTKE